MDQPPLRKCQSQRPCQVYESAFTALRVVWIYIIGSKTLKISETNISNNSNQQHSLEFYGRIKIELHKFLFCVTVTFESAVAYHI